jgi:hypothetical protein
MNPEELSYCGVDCTGCNIFKATVYGDKEALSLAVKQWQKTATEHWRMDSLDPQILNCRGCRVEGEGIFLGCWFCPIRRCCKEHGLSSCGLCSQWKTCEKLIEVFDNEPQAKENLERIDTSVN